MRMLVVVGLLLALVEPGQAQTVSRTPWGDPDLQGLWNNSTVAPMERPASNGEQAVLDGSRGGGS